MKNISRGASLRSEHAQGLCAELARAITSYTGSGENMATAIPRLTLRRRVAPTVPCSITYEPSVTVIAQGRKQVDLGPTTFIYDASRYLLMSVDLPIVSRVVEASEALPCLVLVLKMKMPLVRELLTREDVTFPVARAESPAMATGHADDEVPGAFCRLLKVLKTPEDIPFLSGLIEREIIYRILRGPEGGRLRAIATLGDQSHRTSKVIAWIRANYAKPLRVEDLALMSGMGVSTPHHHFRSLTAMSPLQYQKQLRLQAARGRMLMEDVDAASVAFAVGYESASQFNREYSRFFGQPPVRDIRTLRSPSAPALDSRPGQAALLLKSI